MNDDVFEITDDKARESLNFDKSATQGYILTATDSGNGTQWSPVGLPTDAQTAAAITAWLNAHPEATTTVEDGAITTSKVANGAITDSKVSTILGYSRPEARVVFNKQNIADLTGGDTYTYMQGSTYVSTKNEFVIAFRNADGSSAILVELSTDFETVNDRHVLDLGHANSMCYRAANNHLYVATLTSGENANSIVEIDVATMEIVTTHPVTSPYAVTYDATNDVFYVGYGSASKVAKYDSDFTLIDEITINKNDVYAGAGTLTTQDMTHYRGHILYLCSVNDGYYAGYTIATINADTGEIVGRQLYKTFSANEEAESLTIIGDIGYIFAGNTYFTVTSLSFEKALNTEIDAFGTGVYLGDGTDLNDILTYGKYSTTSAAHASTMLNLPISTNYQGFSLLVMQHVYYNILQIFVTNSCDIYVRKYDAGTKAFSAWRSVMGAQSYSLTTTHETQQVMLKKQGSIVVMNFFLKLTSDAAAYEILATVPTECRPSVQVTFMAMKNGTGIQRVQIAPNGEFKADAALTTGTRLFVALTYSAE